MKPKPSKAFDRDGASDLWRHTVSQIPTSFGRLVYLASLRDANSGRYQHHGLALQFGEEETHRILGDSHCVEFAGWLESDLQDQKGDLDQYMAGLGTDRRTLVESWLRVLPFTSYIPPAATVPERQLFLSDLRLILSLLKIESGADGPDADA